MGAQDSKLDINLNVERVDGVTSASGAINFENERRGSEEKKETFSLNLQLNQ